ncbi:hypothetical protein V6N12_038260 [Hibiscus sabdariffa]|uniref:Uncharacterized protein n=1 Tax=Hibiscus sabdariffa TaxID=183260 RepID=A0ABR2BXJ0_9ROSI
MSISPQVEGSSQVNPRDSGHGGSANGRPPDSVWPALSLFRLERVASPVTVEDQQVVKRSRGDGDDIMDVGEVETLDANLATSMVVDSLAMHRKEGVTQQGHEALAKLSFRDMLVGRGRKPRKGADSKGHYSSENSVSGQVKIVGSRFAVLGGEEIDTIPQGEGKGYDASGCVDEVQNVTRSAGDADNLDIGMPVVSGGDENRVLGVNLNGNEHRLMLKGSGSDLLCKESHTREKDDSVTVALKDVVFREPVTLKNGNHVAVRVVERGAVLGPKQGGDRHTMVGSKDGIAKDKLRIGSAKGGVRPGNPVRKTQSNRAVSKIGLTDWAASLDRELESSLSGSGQPPHGGGEHNPAATIDVQWKDNVSFDRCSK